VIILLVAVQRAGGVVGDAKRPSESVEIERSRCDVAAAHCDLELENWLRENVHARSHRLIIYVRIIKAIVPILHTHEVAALIDTSNQDVAIEGVRV
jgi:hypothetical protein